MKKSSVFTLILSFLFSLIAFAEPSAVTVKEISHFEQELVVSEDDNVCNVFGEDAFANDGGGIGIANAGIYPGAEDSFDNDTEELLYEDGENTISSSDPTADLFADGDIYDLLATGFANFAEEIDISAFGLTTSDEQELGDILGDVLRSDPKLYYVSFKFKYRYNGKKLVTKVLPQYTTTNKNEIESVQARIDTRINEIASLTNDSMSDVEKLLVIYNEIILTSNYDNSLARRTGMDLLLHGESVCQGYASAMHAVASKVGIEGRFIKSEEMNHVWNAFFIDGEWYHLDATFGDPFEKYSTNILYTSFLKSNDWLLDELDYKGFPNVSSSSTAYDNYFWNNTTSPVIILAGNMFFIDGNKNSFARISAFNTQTNVITPIYTFTNIWPSTLDSRYRWEGTFSGLAYKNGRLYFNTNNEVLSCALDGSDIKTEYTLTGTSEDSIYGCCNDEEGIRIYVASIETIVYKQLVYLTFPLVDAVVDNLFTDVGTWDKEFEPCEREYTITVPANVDSISFTGSYTSGSLKCAGLIFMNGRAQAISLSEDITTLTFERVDVSGKNDSKYVITIIKKHSYGDWTVTTEATCTEDGEKKIICTVCGDVKESDILPKLGHDHIYDSTVEATCKEAGYELYICTRCDDEKQIEIPATGHEWSEWEEIKAPTYEESGLETRICGVCGETEDRVLINLEKLFDCADKVEFSTPKTTSLAVGKSITLKATASRTDGLKPKSTAVTYKIIEGEDLATIDAKGKLTAIAEGVVVVRATADFGTEDAYAEITINVCNPATKVTLDKTKVSMIVGGELQLEATLVANGECTDSLTWSVDKEDIATVDENGVVTAHSAGKVKVTATAGSGKSASCTITVGEPATRVDVTALKTTSLSVGKSITIKAKAACEGKTKPVSTAVVFEIIDGDEYATIDAKGKLTGLATGDVIIRVKAEAGTEDAYEDVVISVCNPATKVTLNTTKASMIVGDELQLEATLVASGECTDSLTWSVDKENIATVDEDGVVTALTAGKVKVIALAGSGKKATCTITVGEPATRVDVTALKTTSVAVGKSITIKAKAACEGKTKPVSTAVVFEIIEGEDIATIDAKGKLTAKAEGIVVVRVSAEAGTEDAYEDVEINICNLATKVTLNMTKATIAVGDELQLEATMTAKTGDCTDTLTWSVDKPSIATVDENGVVTAHDSGKVKVTATSGSGKKATCTVTVTE